MHPYFFEIAIYRTSEKSHLDRVQPANNGGTVSAARDEVGPIADAFEDFSEPAQQKISAWQYNQIIGWLRLYVFDDQIRGELWLHSAKRYSENIPNKVFQLAQNSVFQYWIAEDASNVEIYTGLRKQIQDFERRFQGGKRHVDLECFDRSGIVFDWRKLLSLH